MGTLVTQGILNNVYYYSSSEAGSSCAYMLANGGIYSDCPGSFHTGTQKSSAQAVLAVRAF
jgi:hypothetical protein